MNFSRSNKNRGQIIGLIIILVPLIVAQVFAIKLHLFSNKDNPEQTTETKTTEDKIETKTSSSELSGSSALLPDKASLEVPFQVQAPNANWDNIHEDACEEASLLMVYHFIAKTNIVDGDQELTDLLNYESRNSYDGSVTLEDLNKIAQAYYGLNSGQIYRNISVEKIKSELAEGKPVIVGAAGRILNNPNFRDGGPNYHMLVITGYDQNGFITNDPGTRLGKDFHYSFDNLYDAIHDWDSENILNGAKDYLVFD